MPKLVSNWLVVYVYENRNHNNYIVRGDFKDNLPVGAIILADFYFESSAIDLLERRRILTGKGWEYFYPAD